MDTFSDIFQDALFSAIAAIGFAAISRPPKRAYIWCAATAAAGHSLRYILMNSEPYLHIITASLIAALAIGALAVLISALAKFPPETCLFPSLLPMIPGIYAYKAFGGLAMSLLGDRQTFDSYFALFTYNGMMCCAIILSLVVGATLPIFMLKKISFQATRGRL